MCGQRDSFTACNSNFSCIFFLPPKNGNGVRFFIPEYHFQCFGIDLLHHLFSTNKFYFDNFSQLLSVYGSWAYYMRKCIYSKKDVIALSHSTFEPTYIRHLLSNSQRTKGCLRLRTAWISAKFHLFQYNSAISSLSIHQTHTNTVQNAFGGFFPYFHSSSLARML